MNLITTRWNDNTVDLILGKVIINLTCDEAEIAFQELSQILYGRVLKEED